MTLTARACGVLLGLCLPPAAVPALAAAASGRVTVPIADWATRQGVDPFAAGASVGRPDGGVIVAGIDARRRRLVLTSLRGDGLPDEGFGRHGVASLAVPRDRAYYGPFPHDVVRARDGSLLVTSEGPAPSPQEFNRLVVSRVLRTGRLDGAYGSGGSVITPLATSGCAALLADGSLAVTGTVGRPRRYNPDDPAASERDIHAAVTLFDPRGGLDRSFGQDGIAQLTGSRAGCLEVLAGGEIAVTSSTAQDQTLLAVLRPDGSYAPNFNGGRPVQLPRAHTGGIVPRADGSLDVLSEEREGGSARVQRWRPDGSLDPAFGSGGAVDVPSGDGFVTMQAGPRGTLVLTRRLPAEVVEGAHRSVVLARLEPDGRFDAAWGGAAGVRLAMRFGGGYGTFFTVDDLPAVGSLQQSGFSFAGVLVRPDGGVVVTGAVALIEYTGEGDGYLHEEVAATAFTPSLAPDTSFGVPLVRPRLTLSVPRQRARTAESTDHRAIRIDANASAPGLCRLQVWAGRVLIADSIALVTRPGRQRVRALLTLRGRRMLTRARNLPITVTGHLRDLLATQTTARASGRLR